MDLHNASAWSIYCNVISGDAKAYVSALRNAVYRDMRSGKCQLIEELIVTPYQNAARLGYSAKIDVPVLAFCAIIDALNALEHNTRFPELGSGLQIGRNTYEWNYFTARGLNQFDVGVEMNEMHRCTELYTRLCSPSTTALDDYNPAVSGRNIAYSVVKPQKDVRRFFDKANAKAEQILREAEQKAKRRAEEAEAAYDRIIESAKNQAAAIHANANTEADWTRRDARQQAEQIRQDAENDAATIRSNAEAEAARILEEARQKANEEAEQNVAALTQQKLSGHIQELRRQWEEAQEEKARQRADTSALAATLKEDICTVSTTIGARLNRDLEQLQEQLNQLRGNVTLELQQWRSSLYQCEYGKLVIFYNTLNGYANVFERELREAECADNVPGEQKRILAEHSRKLNRLRASLISAMEPMGMRLFTPQKGELFNSYYHTIDLEDDEDEDMFLDHEILACLRPGIERVVNDREVAVLLRASVEVQKD